MAVREWSMEQLDELLEKMMLQGFEKILANEENLLKQLGFLGVKEFNTLDAIWSLSKTKNNTASNIAKSLNITAGTFTTNLQRLLDKGYVYKEKTIQDKRIVYVYLTPAGVGIRRSRETAHKKLLRQALLGLSDSEKVALCSLLNKIDY